MEQSTTNLIGHNAPKQPNNLRFGDAQHARDQGKLGLGHLPWLQLGSAAATVASLSNIDQKIAPEDLATISDVALLSACPDCYVHRYQVGSRFGNVDCRDQRGTTDRLVLVDERLVDLGSLDEGEENEEEQSPNPDYEKPPVRQHENADSSGNDSQDTFQRCIAKSNITQHDAAAFPVRTAKPSNQDAHCSTKECQNVERRKSWPLYALTNNYRPNFESQYCLQELKRDLKLTQAVILATQLLDHAPTLVSRFGRDV